MDLRTPQKQISFSRELRLVLQERNLLSAKSREKVCYMLNGSNASKDTYTEVSNSPMNSDRNRLKDFRCQAVQEIIDTEKAYLNQLEILIEYFVNPLKVQRIIDNSSHTLLFGQIEMIHSLNGQFLRDLEADMNQVAKAFLTMAPFFKVYSVYAFDYRNALLVLQDLTSKNTLFRKFLEQTESRPEVQRKLISLMIVPIQRVPRYKLLLQQVLYYTSPADPDFKILRESIKQIEITVTHINSCVEDQEITQMLINIQNSLLNRLPNIIKPSRKVIKEGILQKITRDGTEIKRYCVLMSDLFMYCKILKERNANTLVENSLECCCIFPLNKCKVYELLPGNFKLTCQGDGIIFSTIDLQLQRAWVAFIRDAIDLHIQCRKTLRKESSKRTPLRRKDVKKFGMDNILSPIKRKGEYETIFRNENRSSDSEDSDDGRACRKRGCFNFQQSKFHKKGLTFYKNRKRRAQSPTIVKTQDYVSRRNGQNVLLEPIALSSGYFEHDPSYGFSSRYSETKTFFQAHNIDSIIPSSIKREDIFQREQQMVDETFSPPLKKRVKFEMPPTDVAMSECGYMRPMKVAEQQVWEDYPVERRMNSKSGPNLYNRIWNFVSNLF